MKKILFITLGTIMVGVGIIGMILPGLPTTIFLILAAYFFSHSSPNLYKKLLDNKTFGPIITNFKDHRGITQKDRKKAFITIWVIFGISITISNSIIVASILVLIGIIHTIYLFRLNLLDD